MSFDFLLESLIVAPIPAEKVTQWFGGDSGYNPFQPDNRHSGLPKRLCGNSISSRPGRKGMVPGTTMALMVAGGVTSIPAAMGVHA